jgi:hypothetical protein
MRKSQTIAMQKVVGSSPISRSREALQIAGFSCSWYVLAVAEFGKPFAVCQQTATEKSGGDREKVSICREREPTTFCIGIRGSCRGPVCGIKFGVLAPA